MNHMKVNVNRKLYGQYLDFITKNRILLSFFIVSRYVFEMYHKKKEISKEVYDYCINEKIVDASLIAKWRKVYNFRIYKNSLDMKDYVVYDVFKQKIISMVLHVFVEFHMIN